jgi:hypothetical protein
MNTDKIIELAFYTLPALITGGVAFYFFQMHTQNEEKRRRFHLIKENQKQALPIKLQAYERLALFLERINPVKLLIRIAPQSEDKMDYQNLLVLHIEQEFEHNLTQQIYVTDDCWTMILTAKNTVIQTIRKTALQTTTTTADNLRETILSNQIESESSTTIALSYLKNEVIDVLG